MNRRAKTDLVIDAIVAQQCAANAHTQAVDAMARGWRSAAIYWQTLAANYGYEARALVELIRKHAKN